jgi:hypothetical protein
MLFYLYFSIDRYNAWVSVGGLRVDDLSLGKWHQRDPRYVRLGFGHRGIL